MHNGFKSRFTLLWGVILVVAVAVAACGPATDSGGPTEGGEALKTGEQQVKRATLEQPGVRGGKLTMGIAQTFFGNPDDPHLVTTSSGRGFAVPVTNGLIKRDLYDPTNKIVPELADSWQVSNDGLTYTFKLKQGIKFQNVAPVNGREFTSEDAKFSLRRIAADPNIIPDKSKARFQRKGEFDSVQSIETPDKSTLVIKLKEPYAPFMDSLSHPGTLMIPKEFVDKFPDGLILEGMVGTGPYIPASYTRNQSISYKRNPDYWKKDAQNNQLPYLDELSMVAFSDSQAELASFRARQIDTTASNASLTSSLLEPITKADPTIKVLITPRASIALYRFNMNFKPFQDVRVRRALHLATDRHQMVNILSEGRDVVQGPVTPFYKDLANSTDWLLSQPGYRKDKKEDLEEAKRLLKEAGYEGLTFTGLFSAGGSIPDTIALLTDQFKAIGVTMKAETAEYAGQWLPKVTNNEFEMAELGHTVALDADSLLYAHMHSKGGRNYGKINDPKLDDLIVKQRIAVSTEERKKWAQEAEKYILEQSPMVIMWAATNVKLAQPWVHNVADGPVLNEYESAEWAWLDKR